ncbi:unnamed protein product, partial [Amoebophrya sp. A25]|eukprot:GSA25T00001189001.1
MCHLLKHRVCLIRGTTGSGKSTRVPLFIKEMFDSQDVNASAKLAGKPAKILVLQPRRLACTGAARRTTSQQDTQQREGESQQQQQQNAKKTSKKVNKNAWEIVFSTTGYFLEVLIHRPEEMARYTHILIDEVHERSLDADMVNLILRLFFDKQDFRLILMSATLEHDIFQRYYSVKGRVVDQSSVLEVGVDRVFPVLEVYLEDLMGQPSAAKSGKGGKNKNAAVVASTAAGGGKSGSNAEQHKIAQFREREKIKKLQGSFNSNANLPAKLHEGVAGFLRPIVQKFAKSQGSILIFVPGMSEIMEAYGELSEFERGDFQRGRNDYNYRSSSYFNTKQIQHLPRREQLKFRVYPLHSNLPQEDQDAAVKKAPETGYCHIIISSNIAESSLTICGVNVVVDTGLRRAQTLSTGGSHNTNSEKPPTSSGANAAAAIWCSKASVKQRMGRTGRTGPGISIRLFTKHFYDNVMKNFDEPEMNVVPLDQLYIKAKFLAQRLQEQPHFKDAVQGDTAAGGTDPSLALQPRQLLQKVPSPPAMDRLDGAVHSLVRAHALTDTSEQARVTALGHLMMTLSMDISLARLLFYASLFSL